MDRLDTFYFLCDCLSPFSVPEKLQKTLGKREIAWESVIAAAGYHLVTPALYWALREKGLLRELPDDVHDYLEAVWTLNFERNQKLSSQLVEVCGLFNRHGIQPLLLKGAITLVTECYPNIGVRVMNDLDMLIPEERLADAREILYQAGYADAYSSDDAPDHHHLTPLTHSEKIACIELHRGIVGQRYAELLPAAAVLDDSVSLTFMGVSAKQPSPIHRIQHNIVHSHLQDGNNARHNIDLRQLYEFIMLLKQFEAEIDWEAVRLNFSAGSEVKALANYPLLAQHLFSQKIPPGMPAPKNLTRQIGCFERGIEYPWVMRLRRLKYSIGNMIYGLVKSPKNILKLTQLTWYSSKYAEIKRAFTKTW